eukprot:3267984-Pyramimonas_sp.AAC.1
METYDEAVFSEPLEAFYTRVSAIAPPPAVMSDITPLRTLPSPPGCHVGHHSITYAPLPPR